MKLLSFSVVLLALACAGFGADATAANPAASVHSPDEVQVERSATSATAAGVAPAAAAAPAAAPAPAPTALFITAANGLVWEFQQNALGSWDVVAVKRAAP
jgi:hypothetical protein